eukprot:3314701-Rhodomonas_salina.1
MRPSRRLQLRHRKAQGPGHTRRRLWVQKGCLWVRGGLHMGSRGLFVGSRRLFMAAALCGGSVVCGGEGLTRGRGHVGRSV